MRLDQEQAEKNADGDRQHQRLETSFHDREPLHRGEHGDRRCDHGITIKQGGRQHAQHDDAGTPAPLPGLA